jgi:NAD(P)-dependent dehydrogenase (short-subunit alcohol dehydrogenase family)
VNPLDAYRLDDRVVVLTGASSGLGVGFARALAAVGAHLVLAARRTDRLGKLAAELAGAGTHVITHTTDVSAPEDCRAVARRAVEEFGRIDVLINNAGVGGVVPASCDTPESFSRVIDVNLSGTFWMAQACAPVMAAFVNDSRAMPLRGSSAARRRYQATIARVLPAPGHASAKR